MRLFLILILLSLTANAGRRWVPGTGSPPTNGLVGWYKGEAGRYDSTVGGSLVTTDGSAIARWEDQSGNGNHLTQSTSARRPVKYGNFVLGSCLAEQWFTRPSVSLNPAAMSCFAIMELNNLRQMTDSSTLRRWHFLLATATASAYVDGEDGKFYISDTVTQAGGVQPLNSRCLLGFAEGATSVDIVLNGSTSTFSFTGGAADSTGTVMGHSAISEPLQAKMLDLLVYNRTLSAAEIATLQAYAQSRGAIFNSTATRRVGISGDSISAVTVNESAPVPWINQTTVPNGTQMWNASEASTLLSTLYSERTSFDDLLYRSGIPNVLFITAGSNDINQGGGAAGTKTTLTNYGTAEKSTGYKVVVSTMMARTDCTGGNETARGTYNSGIVADFGVATVPSYADGIMDWAGDPDIGSAAADTSKFPDGIHPNNATAAVMAKYAAPFIADAGFTISGPSGGVYTVTIASGGEFRGQMKVRLSASAGTIDATAAGGTITGDNTATVTVTPAAGQTTFTFACSTTMTVTFTNAQGWTNPSNLSVP